MQAAGRKGKQLFNEINITPLTDIFLVLLIIMMVVAPMMQQVRQDIKPPSLKNGENVDQNKLTVEITRNGSIYVQGQETPPDRLLTTLREQEARLAAGAGSTKAVSGEGDKAQAKNLIIRADKATRSGQVLKIFDAARDAGFAKVTVAGEALNAERQEQLEQTKQEAPLSSQLPPARQNTLAAKPPLVNALPDHALEETR
jgi:biopolymer transport protein ExbD